jgi:hypothetical protein
MFVHQMRRAVIKSDNISKFDEYLDELPDGFRRILLPARKHIAQSIGLPVDSVTGLSFSDDPLGQITSGLRIIKAELIATDSHLFVLAVQPMDSSQNRISSGMLRIHSLGPSSVSKEMTTLCKFFETKLSIRLKSTTYSSPRFDDLKAEGRASPKIPSAEEVAAADALSDGAIRTLAIAVKQSSGLLVGDLDRQLHPEDRPRIKEIRNSLESHGMVGEETVVICRKTSAQVARVPDPAMLADAAKRGWRCSCGSNIDNEKIDVALSITDRGRRLLDGSRWLTILLIHHEPYSKPHVSEKKNNARAASYASR